MNVFRKFRRWFIETYLRAYVSEADREDIAALGRENDRLSRLLEKERAYSAGLLYACRRRVKVSVERGESPWRFFPHLKI